MVHDRPMPCCTLADHSCTVGIGRFGHTNENPAPVFGAGIAVALAGLVIPAVRGLYDYAWFVGFAVAGAVYLALVGEKK